MKVISIIIASLNPGRKLQGVLNSIRIQKTDEIELLLIDGGSGRDTMNIIESNSDIIDCVVSERDKGIYDAWNKGIERSTGSWVMFLGSDDLLADGSLRSYLAYLNNVITTDVDYICAKMEWLRVDGRVIKAIGAPWNWGSFRKGMQNIAHVGSLHSRTLFHQVGCYDLSFKVSGDYELLLRKKDLLKTLFINRVMTKVTMGGISCSNSALFDGFRARRLHGTLPFLFNCYVLAKKIAMLIKYRIQYSLIF